MEQPSGKIDELLRQRLREAAVPPPAFVWPKVEKALRQRKRRVFFWLLAVGVAGSGIWTVWNRPYRHPNPTTGIPASPATIDQNRLAASAPATALQPGAAGLPDHTPAAGPGMNAARPAAFNSRAGTTSQPRRSTAKGNTLEGSVTATPAIGAGATGDFAERGDQSPVFTAVASTPGQTGAELLPGRLAGLDEERPMPKLSPVQIQTSTKKAPRRCYDFHGNRQAWLFDAYAGPSFIRKTLSTNNPEYKDYVQDRLATEHRELAFNAGVRVSYLFAENFLVRTGLNYDQFVEKFEYFDPDYVKYYVEITQKVVNGVIVSVPDTVKIEYGSNYVKTYNRFGLLDIPLQAALELRSGPTGISLNLGGSVNLLFWKRGSMLALNGEPIDFTPRKHKFDVYRSRLGLSLLGSIQWFYHISPRTRVFAEPYYRRVLEPVMRGGYPIEQNYGVGGIRFGMTRILN